MTAGRESADRRPSPGVVRDLPWESAFFGFSIALLEPGAGLPDMEAVEREIAARGIRLLQCRCARERRRLIARLEASCFARVQTHVAFARPVPPPSGAVSTCRPANAADIPRLRELAMGLFDRTRFHRPEFPPEKSRELYGLWIEKAVRGQFDHLCLVEGPPGQVQAFATLRLTEPGTGRIGLIGVAPSARGTGLGRTLLEALSAWAAGRGLARMEVVTQIENTRAIRLYARCGFQVTGVENWYYRWNPPSRP